MYKIIHFFSGESFELYLLTLLMISACSKSTENVVQSNDDKEDGFALIQAELDGDSLLPYFEFDNKGNKIEFDLKNEALLMKENKQRSILILDSIQNFIDLEYEIALKLELNSEYRNNIVRPLDYVCRTSLLALNQMYSFIITTAGDTLLFDELLFKSCEYIGFSCDNNCDETAEEDPYLNDLKILKKIIENNDYSSNVTVEIYPYRMIASSFVKGISFIYSSAGAETYFKKRQRVWRGLSGMVWRWADFDPDRNGIRVGCYDCEYKLILNTNDFIQKDSVIDLVCNTKTNSDLDTWGDSEDITLRCDLSMVIKSIGGSVSEEGDVKPKVSFQFVQKYEGGVIGMHYIRHGDHHFKARTSKGLSADIINHVKTKYPLSYR